MNAETLMQALEETASTVATLTGIRQQFIDAGWKPTNAEQAVIELLRKS